MRLLVLIAATLTLTMSATAAFASPLRTDRSAAAEQHLQLKRYYHAGGYLKAIGAVARRTIYNPNPLIRVRWKRAAHYLAFVKHDAYVKLAIMRGTWHPAPAVAHWKLWSCITNGAYPGAAHEGNGYNGAYVGPLGMTTPWAGHYPSGSDWVHTPVATVYSYAEEEYRQSGYSTAWLEGQWPNTSPPCLGFR